MRVFWIFCALCVWGVGIASAAPLTFDEALSRMVTENEGLAAMRSAKEVAEHEREAARGLYYPKVKVTGRWTRIDDPIVMDLSSIKTAMGAMHGIGVPGGTPTVADTMVFKSLPDFTMEVQGDTFLKSSLTATMPLYAGGKIRAVNTVAISKVEEASQKERETLARLTATMVGRYYGVRLAKEVQRVRQHVLEGMETHLHQARQLEKNGMIAKAERLHAEVARAEADRGLKRARRNVAIATTALSNLLKFSPGETPDPVSPLFLSKGIGDLSHFTDAAKRLSPVLGQLKEKARQAGEGIKVAKAGHLPSFYLFGKRELRTQDLTTMEPAWAAGVGVDLPIFEGFSVANKLRAATSRKAQVVHMEAQVRKDILTATEKNYHEALAQLEQYEALHVSLALAQEAVRVQSRAFEQGFSTSLDVVDARLTLAGVEIKQLQAVYAFDVALAKLLAVSGLATTLSDYQSETQVEARF